MQNLTLQKMLERISPQAHRLTASIYDGQPEMTEQEAETRLFLMLEDPELDPAFVPDDGLRVAFRLAQRYVAFQARYHHLTRPETRLSDAKDWAMARVPDHLRHAPHEWIGFVAIFENGELSPLCVVGHGNRNRVAIDPIDLFARVLILKPMGFFLIHNHPSGDLRPSREDVRLTSKVQKACHSIGLKFFGHGIVSSVGENWICDISPSHDYRAARKQKTYPHSAASSGAG